MCSSLKTSYPLAGELCELLAERGETIQTLDTGLVGKGFSAPTDHLARPNGNLEPQEIYARATEIIENEILPLGDIVPEDERNLFTFKAWQLGFRVPAVLYDGNPTTKDDVEARLLIRNRIIEIWREALEASNSEENIISTAAQYRVAQGLLEFVQELIPNFALSPELSALLAIKYGKGDCTENSMLLYTMMKMAGLDAGIAYITTDLLGDEENHLSAFVRIEEKILFADPVKPYHAFPAEHKKWTIVPLLSVTFLHHRNRHLDVRDGVTLPTEEQDNLLPIDTLLSLDPSLASFFTHNR
jgi:hypothetical protein